MNNFTKTLKALVGQNKIKLVLAVLTDFWQDKNQALYNECLLLHSNWLQAEHDYSAGLIDRKEVTQVLNRVKMGLIHQTDVVATESFDLVQAMERAARIQNQFAEEEVSVPKEKSAGLWVWLLVFPVLLGGIWFGKDLFVVKTPGAIEQPAVHRTLKDTLAEVDALRKQADNLIRSNQEEGALALLSKAVALQQMDYELYNQRADLYFKMGRYPQAENDAERAIRLNPNCCLSYVTIAQIMTKRNRTADFYANLEKALQKNTEGKCDIWQYDELPGIIEHRNEPRFKKLIADYRR